MSLLRSYDVAVSDEALDAARSAADEDVRAPYLESRAGSPTSMTGWSCVAPKQMRGSRGNRR